MKIRDKIQEADNLWHQGLFAEANKMLDSLLEENDRTELGEDYYLILTEKCANLWMLGDTDNALPLCLDMVNETKHLNEILYQKSLNNLACCYWRMDEIEKAINLHKECITIIENKIKSEKIKSEKIYLMERLSISYNNISVCFRRINLIESSIIFIKKALSLSRQLYPPQHREIGHIYHNIGHVYSEINALYAIEYTKKGLNIRLASCEDKEHKDIGQSYHSLAINYCYIKDYETALFYIDKATSIRKKKCGINSTEYATSNSVYALILRAIGKYDDAINYLNETGRIFTYRSMEQSYARSFLFEMGECQIKLSKLSDAEKNLLLAIEILSEKENLKYDIASCYKSLSQIYLLKNKFDKSLSLINKGIELFYENYSYKYTSDSKIPIIFDFRIIDMLELKLNILYKSINNNKYLLSACFKTIESLVKFINQKKWYYRFIFFQTLFIEKSHQLIGIIGKLHATLVENNLLNNNKCINIYQNIKSIKNAVFVHNFSEKTKLSNSKIAFSNFNSINRQINDLTLKISSETDHIKKELLNDRRFELVQKSYTLMNNYDLDDSLGYNDFQIDIDDIQKSLLDDEAIIDYYIGPENGTLFIITKNSFHSHNLNLHKNFQHQIKNFRAIIENQDSDIDEYIDDAYEIYEILFPKGLQIKGITKLIVIPSGELLYLPFEALITIYPPQDSNLTFQNLRYLILDYELTYSYSVNYFYKSRNINENNIEYKTILTGFAPTYSREDAEKDIEVLDIQEKITTQETLDVKFIDIEETVVLQEGFRKIQIGETLYENLKHNISEINSIENIFKAQGFNNIKLHRGKEASLDVFKQDVYSSKYVIIAGHSAYNSNNPDLSGILFTPQISENNSKVGFSFEDIMLDFILYNNMIYDIQMNTDLLIISCCESGIGALYHSEGMMSASRAFSYAGVKNIIYTLFKIPDYSSSQLTKTFFELFFKGLSYSQALQKAKKTFIKQENSHPYQWAGFILLGQ